MAVPSIRERCQHIVDATGSLSPTEIDELFKILHANGCDYSRNDNGVFVNLRWVDDAVVRKIEQFLAFCNRNRVELEKYERLRRLLTDNFSSAHAHISKHALAADAVAAGGEGVAAGDGADAAAGGVPAAAPEAADADADIGADACGEPAPVRKAPTQTGAITTMKFYLLKKKFSKPTNASQRFEQGELVKESPLLAQKRS